MLRREQKDSIMKLYGEGLNITEIAGKVGVSRHSVYRTIQSDFEEDPEIHALKKRLEKAKLEKSIREVRRPFVAEGKMNKLEKAVDRLASRVLILWSANPDFESEKLYCPYCGEELEYRETKNRRKMTIENQQYACHGCGKVFSLSP